MKRGISYRKENGADFYISIPDTAAITITENCGECGFCVRASAGTKPVCGHPRILAKRPYTTGENNRSIIYEVMPPWCPLYTKEYNPNEN